MKIAFYNIFGEMKNAEQETLLRLEYCFKKQGHKLIVFDRNGFVTSDGADKGKYIEDINADFIFTYNALEFIITTFPDVFSVFFHWVPSGFLANFQSKLLLNSFNCYDSFVGTYQIDLFDKIDRISIINVPFIGSSVPLDFSFSAKKLSVRKLFYVGVNVEKKIGNMRYETLFKRLDNSNKIDIYGPKKVYGMDNLWAGFKCYKGEIPFDGKSILEKINQAGICLALNSPMHNDANAVSNRTYEAAAAGALIISDDNKFVRKYFKDSVFYIDVNLPEEEIAKRVLEIVDWANENPDEAYEMAKRSNEIFKKELALDRMVEDTISAVKQEKSDICDITKQKDIVDVICFAYSQSEYDKICLEIDRQYYKNINLIVLSNYELNIRKKDTFIKTDLEFKGDAFLKAIPFLKGQYFMFVDVYSIMHQRHISKTLDVLKNLGDLFSYSGCYLKGDKKYITLNNRPIIRDEFLSFSNQTFENFKYRDEQNFYIETIFSRSCSIFKKEILNYIDEYEIARISDSVHFYLACCSIIKAQKLGRFTNAITTGYKGDSVNDINQTVFACRKHWYQNDRSAKTYIKEMNEAFYKYTFETTPYFSPNRSLEGECCWFNELNKSSENNISSEPTIIYHPIMNSKWMKRLLKRSEKSGVTRLPYFIYKAFSLYCKTKSIFKKGK